MINWFGNCNRTKMLLIQISASVIMISVIQSNLASRTEWFHTLIIKKAIIICNHKSQYYSDTYVRTFGTHIRRNSGVNSFMERGLWLLHWTVITIIVRLNIDIKYLITEGTLYFGLILIQIIVSYLVVQ